jgi:hypothetical protein
VSQLTHYGLDLLATILRYWSYLSAVEYLVAAWLIHLINALIPYREWLIGRLQIVHHLLYLLLVQLNICTWVSWIALEQSLVHHLLYHFLVCWVTHGWISV